jgi:putative endopeptidase
MKKVLFYSLMVLAMTACHKAPKQSTGIDLNNLDTTAVAQNDFYQYACGGWMASHPLPGEYARFGTFDELGLRNLEQVNGLIQDLAKDEHKHGSIEQKIGDIYNLAMDTARRNQEGIEPIRKSLDQINAISDRSEFSAFLGTSMECGLFGMYVDADAMNSSMNILNECQAGFALGEKEYYFDDDDATKAIREAYLKHVAAMFALCGIEDADAKAATVLRLETRLAGAALNNVELRDPVANYNKMSIAELKTLVPEIDWDIFFAGMDIAPDSLSVGQIRHLKEVGKMLTDEPLDDLKTLFTWQVIDGAGSYLSDAIYDQNFDFYGRILSGKTEQSPLWKRAVGTVNGTLGEAVGQMYVKKYFP